VEAAKRPIRVNLCLGSDEECNRSRGCATYHCRPEAQDALASVPRSGARHKRLAIEEAAMQAAESTIIRRYGGSESLLYA
jgi:hypothetical protein